MRTPIHVTRKDGEKELAAALKDKSLANAHIRIRAVLAIAGGRRVPDIAKTLSVEQRTIRNWAYQYNRCGLEGLHDHRGGKRKCRLNAAQQEVLKRRIEAGPVPDDCVCSLRGLDIQRILFEQFGLHYSLSGVYYLLHNMLRMSYLKPRPLHHKADIAQQQAFKKTFTMCWSRSDKGIRVNVLTSGLKMKAGLGNKGR